MKLSNLNRWLSLIANSGVLVGIIFLILELDQSNRIAIYDAESMRRSQFLNVNATRIENADIVAKLMHPNPELSEPEYVKALYICRQQINTWIDGEMAYNNGLLSELTFEELLIDIDVMVAEMPGLKSAYLYIFESFPDVTLVTMRRLREAVANL